jgi:LDH2 family malate/lactate/ureidoglycolate dehydrogenase
MHGLLLTGLIVPGPPCTGALNAACFVAWDVEAFTDIQDFQRSADSLLSSLRQTPAVLGEDRVLYPGLRGAELTAQRSKHGIPYHPEV